MSLLDEIRAEGTSKGPTCSVCLLISSLTGQDADDLNAALDKNSGFTAAQIARALSQRGTKIADHAMARHRGGRCGGTR